MKRAEERQDFGLAVVLLRTVLGWNRPMLSQRSGIDEDLIGDYERGLRSPIRKNRVRLAQAFAVEPSFLEDLVPVCRSIRLAYESAARGGRAAVPSGAEIGRMLERTVPRAVLESMEPFLLELRELGVQSVPRHEDRSWARAVGCPGPLPAESRSKIVQLLRETSGSGRWRSRLERRVARPRRTTQRRPCVSRNSPRRSLERLRTAGVAITPEGLLRALLGQRAPVAGKLTAAREAFAHADELWLREGAVIPPACSTPPAARFEGVFSQVDGRTEEALVFSRRPSLKRGPTGRAAAS